VPFCLESYNFNKLIEIAWCKLRNNIGHGEISNLLEQIINVGISMPQAECWP